MTAAGANERKRLRVEIHGAVQGVGFRPFVYRLASGLGLGGWVINDARGVFIEVEGAAADLDAFVVRLKLESPPRAIIHSLEAAWAAPLGETRFEIRHSAEQGTKTALVLPDIAVCPDCLRETLDPANRRYRYPFTNCTNCGPRFSIIQALPYDRPNTTMSRFTMCADCRAEYENPADRRFHAQPNACPVCGPQLALWAADGKPLCVGDVALRQAAQALRQGRIVAVKGLGGFLLMADARQRESVALLRRRKRRYDKPLAVMVQDLAAAEKLCDIAPAAEALLQAAEAPIVLMPAQPGSPAAPEVAPGNPNLGVMLPYTPLHHLLLREADAPLVATSGNLSDEPICIDEDEALARLGGIADFFLVHDRPIERHVDDSVAWVVAGEARLLRRARGYAPLPVLVKHNLPPILGVGAHLKNTVAFSVGRQVFISQHIGDLETPEAMAAFERVIADFLRLYEATPAAIAHDLHPDYLSTHWAQQAGGRLIAVQHHHAHLAACLAENNIDGPALGVTWDGAGFGEDGTIWGGEFLLGDAAGYRRVAHLRPFRLPGGDAAARQPARVALALLYDMGRLDLLNDRRLAPVAALAQPEQRTLLQMLERGVRSPITTSAGRLFDGVAALLGLRQQVSFEGQAAMDLEYCVDARERGRYEMPVAGSPLELDWRPLIEGIVRDLQRGVERSIIAARFHNTLVQAIAGVAHALGERRVALSGGCFQNRLLSERTAESLRAAGCDVLLHRQTPPNDGCVALGQVVVAAQRLAG